MMGKVEKLDQRREINKALSEKLYIIKFFAIISVVMAHSCYSEVQNSIDSYILGRYARYGVFAFFLLSGFFYKKEKNAVFLKKTVWNLVVPWMFVGTIIHLLIMLLLEHRLRFDGYFDYIIGNGSTLYFCSMLLILRLIFQFFAPRRDRNLVIFCICCILITLISLFSTASGLLPDDFIEGLSIFQYLNPYLNLFNWIGIFALGVIFRSLNIFEHISSNKNISYIAVVISIIVIVLGYFDSSYSYWSYLGIYVEFSTFILIYYMISNLFHAFNRLVIINIGKNTLPIFLLHYPVLALLMKGDVLRSSFAIGVIRPLICVLILYAIIQIILQLALHFKCDSLLKKLTGIKNS